MERQRIVIVGAGGRLGAALLRTYGKSYQLTGFNHAQLDLASSAQLKEKLGSLDFDLLLNCAAQTNVDRCETERVEAFALNAEAPRVLAEICAQKAARMIHISTDYVFDGARTSPYAEEDEAAPISVYGESKREGERYVLAADAGHLVVRVSWVFGRDRPSFVDWAIQQARTKDRVEAIADKFSTPSYTLDLAQMLELFFTRDRSTGGILHLTNGGECSWQEYGQWALDCCKAEGIALRTDTIEPVKLSSMKNFIARRPPYTVLSTAKFERLTGEQPRLWREAVAAYVREEVKGSLT